MASMYPEIYPKAPDPNDPEFQVFEILRELPDEFSVIYSKKFKGGLKSKEETEIDFLIFDGKKNLICLEVKGGEIAYNGVTGKWYQNGKEMKRSPDWQASAATHAVIEFLAPDSAKININWALAFPQCSRLAGTGRIAEVADDLILDEKALLNPEKAISRVCRYNEERFGKEGVSKYLASQILERLLRSINYITKTGVRLIRDTKQLIQVTQEQLAVLEDLEVNPRMAVMGYAGTGKTVLAQEFAKRLNQTGKAVLLLFYNRMVANAVRHGLGRDSSIKCVTFHSLARELISEFDATWWDAQDRKKEGFWEETIPLRLLDLPPEKLPKFDSIIIDEGQDFKPDWFEILEDLCKKSESSRFAVFYDENQDIFGRWKGLPWGSSGVARKVLKRNCRNTKTIIEYLNSVLPSEMVAFDRSPSGQPVSIKSAKDEKQAVALIKENIQTLLKEGVDPGQIVILVNKPYSESAISSIDKISRYPVKWMGRTYRQDSKSIQVTSIKNFKGLEADVIFIENNSRQNKGEIQKTLYTQASRARLLLKIYQLEGESA